MEIKRRICDLCGGTIRKDEPHGTLKAPNYAKLAVEPPKKKHEESMFGMFVFTFGGPSHDEQEYDVCKGCVEGLLRARDFVRSKADEFQKASR